MSDQKVICEFAEKCERGGCGHNIPHPYKSFCTQGCTYSGSAFGIKNPKYISDVHRDIQKQFDELIGEL